MGFLVGSGSVCQVGKQANFATPVAPDTLVNMTSESFSVSVEKGDEGNLLASKTAAQRDVLAIVTEGGIDTVLRPEFADWLFECAMGVKTGTAFTLAAPNVQLPVSTVVISRGGIVKTYPSNTIRSLTIEAPAQDYVRASFDMVGTYEIASGGAGAQTIDSSLSFSKPSYRCTNATLQYGAGGSAPNNSLCVESCSITIDNAVEDSPATYCSGLYNEQPVPGLRSVTASINIPYSQALDTFRTTYLLDPTSPTVSLKLTFTTSNNNEKIEILIPHLTITEAGGNVGGTGILDASFSGEALSVGSTEPITVTVTHSA